MSDSQRPKPPVPPSPPGPPRSPRPSFEIPDLELDTGPRVTPRASPRTAPQPAPDLFDEDAGNQGRPSLDLDLGPSQNGPLDFGSSVDFGDTGSFELEPLASPPVPPRAPAARMQVAPQTGQAPDPTQLNIDPAEIAILADYGEVPSAAQLTPMYALRVFTRQRELKHELVRIAAESARAESERQSTLAELTRAVRPQAEQIEQFRRLFAPLVELEQVASQRGQALSSISDEVSARSSALDGELADLGARIQAEVEREAAAQRAVDERNAASKRADAKLKRVNIEIRNVLSAAEQKLGPQGGAIPDPEAAQLAELRARASALQPEVDAAQSELSAAQLQLDRLHAQLEALRQGERQIARKKQAIGDAFQKEMALRSASLTDSEAQQRSLLADLGRAILATNGAVEVPEPWLTRMRAADERANQLAVRAEMQRRAIDSYDKPRAAQGVRLVLTVVGIVFVLLLLKAIF